MLAYMVSFSRLFFLTLAAPPPLPSPPCDCTHQKNTVIDDEQPNKKQQTSGGAAGGNAEVKGSVGGEALPAVAAYVENSARPPPTGSFVSGGFDMVSVCVYETWVCVCN